VRVLHFLDTEQFAGTEQHALVLLKFLARAGVECSLLCRADNAEFAAKAQSVSGLRVLATGGGKREMIAALKHAVATHSPDIVHSHNGRTSLYASLLRGQRTPKRVFTQHFVHPAHAGYRGFKGKLAHALHQWINSRTDAIIAVSTAARRAMIEREGVPPEKVQTIWHGIEPPQPNAERARQILQQHGVGKGRIFLTIARLAAEKNHFELLLSITKLAPQLPDVRWVWVGGGELEAELREIIRNNGLEQAVTLLGYQDNASDFLAVANALVLPSACEPFGLVLLEAMMCGVPTIATDCGGPAEIIAPAHGETETTNAVGWLARPDDAEDLTRTLLSFSQRSDGGKPEAERARIRALTEFTAERMAAQTLELYHRILR
jgi:L-malate glycosyltransferase